MDRNESERRVGLEKDNVKVDPVGNLGKTDLISGSERHEYRCVSAGILVLTHMEREEGCNTGNTVNGAAHTEPVIGENWTSIMSYMI